MAHTSDRSLATDTPPGSIESLIACGARRTYRKGVILIEEGDRGDSLYVIVSGRVRVYLAGPKGREITLGIYGTGEYVGEMSLDGGPRSASVITMEPTECSVVARDALVAHIANEPEFAFGLLARVIRRARVATEDVRNLALIDVYGRLSRVLEGLAEEQPDGTRVVPLPMTHAELASRVGCSREMVTRLLKDLEKGGYVGRAERRLELLRPFPPGW
jgi:CRP/FNR family cyclic AMP-dependent transcriptional regulator